MDTAICYEQCGTYYLYFWIAIISKMWY
jgi:hypothetical protein